MSNLLSQASLVMIPSGYKEDIVYSPIPTDGSGDLSFTRASDGTRINSAGLVEVVAWNLADNSNGFGGLSAITKTTGQISPIDSTSGNLLTATGSGEHYSGTLALTAIVGNSYTYSAYGKFVQGVQFALRTVFSNGDQDIATIWNLSTGALVSNAGQHTNPTITAVGNGYYRCSITYTPSTVPAFPLLFRLQMAVGGALSFTASSGDGFLAYGAQINNGAIAPYFPTTDRLNVPRLTYQNGGGGCPSLLLEKQSTNLYPYSEDLTQWLTIGTPTITGNNAISPDGTTNADRVQFSASGDLVYNSGTGSVGANVLTVYAKAKTGTAQKFRFFANGATTFSSDLTATDQWQRFEFPFTLTVVTAGLSAASTGASDVLFWGFQHEVSSYPTSYIPTTSASATRVAEICAKTGISSLIGQTEGVLFIDFDFNGNYSSGGIIPISTVGTPGSEMYIWVQTSGLLLCEVANSGIQASISGAIGAIGRKKVALAYKQNDFVVYLNGTQVGTDTSGTVPTQSAVYIGKFYANDTYNLNAGINQAVLFPTRLTNTELASLTTL